MIAAIRKIFKSVSYAMKGFRHAFRDDTSFRFEILIGLPIYVVVGYLLSPLSSLEWGLFVLSYNLILMIELINTSIEKLLERLHPEKHELIGHSKDIASAAVLLSFVFAGITVLLLFFHS